MSVQLQGLGEWWGGASQRTELFWGRAPVHTFLRVPRACWTSRTVLAWNRHQTPLPARVTLSWVSSTYTLRGQENLATTYVLMQPLICDEISVRALFPHLLHGDNGPIPMGFLFQARTSTFCLSIYIVRPCFKPCVWILINAHQPGRPGLALGL